MFEANEISPRCTYVRVDFIKIIYLFFRGNQDNRGIGPRRTDAYKTKIETSELDRILRTDFSDEYSIFIAYIE